MGAEAAGLYALHILFAGLWTGSVLFVTIGILPAARNGDFDAKPLTSVVGRLRTVSRISAVVLPLTGIRMAMGVGGLDYTDTSVLLETTNGYLLIGMIVLWFALAALTEIGAGKLADGLDDLKVRSPAREARPFFLAASAVAVLLLVDAGLLAGL